MKKAKIVSLTDNQRLLCAKFGLTEDQYLRALNDLVEYEKRQKSSKPKPLNACDKRFLDWFSKAYSELPEDEDFLLSSVLMYETWTACWRRAYAVGYAEGRKAENTLWQMKVKNLPRLPPLKREWLYLTDEEIRGFCDMAGVEHTSLSFYRVVQAIETCLRRKNS
jgi:hypothetical protein